VFSLSARNLPLAVAILVRWISARTIKETFAPPHAFEYPFMAEK
jgi:hypothetical protein